MLKLARVMRHRFDIATSALLHRQRCQNYFFILGEARTVTNLLASYLRSTPMIDIAGETNKRSESENPGGRRCVPNAR